VKNLLNHVSLAGVSAVQFQELRRTHLSDLIRAVIYDVRRRSQLLEDYRVYAFVVTSLPDIGPGIRFLPRRKSSPELWPGPHLCTAEVPDIIIAAQITTPACFVTREEL
jgi:hypothetical protein